MDPSSERGSRRKLVLGVVTLVVAVVATDLGFRLLTGLFWPQFTSAGIRESMGVLAASTRDRAPDAQRRARESIHPYFGYVTTPGIGMREKSYPVTRDRLIYQVGPGASPWWFDLRANNWGFFSPHTMPYRSKPDDFVIVILGGSVAQWLALQGQAVLTAELETRVAALAEKDLVVLNFAQSGFKQPQQAQVLTYLLSRGIRPDAVVNIDGFNEAAIGYHNGLEGVSPDYPRTDLWPFLLSDLGYSERVLSLLGEQFREKELISRWAERAARWSKVSNVLGFVSLQVARRSQAREQILHAELQQAIAADVPASRQFAIRGPTRHLSEEARIEEVVRAWFDGSVALSTITKGLEIPYLHVLQPVLHDHSVASAKTLTPIERSIAATRTGSWGAWADGVRKIYPLLRERADALREAGVAFEDASSVFASIPTTIYYDICHYNQEGNEIFARAIAARLARELQQLVGPRARDATATRPGW